MRKPFVLLLIAVLFIGTVANAQQILEDAAGRPFRASQGIEASGNPLLYEDWMLGTVELQGGKVYKDVPLNINLLDQQVLFKGKDGASLIFTDNVSSISFAGADGKSAKIFQRGFPNTSHTTGETYFQVLADGSLTLLKRQWKVIWEEKTYNSATITKTLLDKNELYIFDKEKNELTLVKPSKSKILSLMSKHQSEVETFIKDNKTNFSKDESLAQLFVYYNGL